MAQLQHSTPYLKTSRLYNALDGLFYGLEKGSEKINIPGSSIVSGYFKTLGDFTRDNLAPSLKYDIKKEDYIQKKGDVETINMFESAVGKKYGGAGSLGPKLIFDTLKPGKNHAIQSVLPLQPIYPASVSNNLGWLPYGVSKRPVIGVLETNNKHEALNFVSDQNVNPNAAFATTGFTKIKNKRPREKKYKLLI